jgi:DNA-binding CsgD family transcriptional regulator
VSSEPIGPSRRQRPSSLSSHPRRTAILSSRELEVVELVVSGLPMKSVARRLGIAPRTVAFHKYRAMKLLGLKGNVELVDYAIQHGLLRSKAFAAEASDRDPPSAPDVAARPDWQRPSPNEPTTPPAQ